MLGEIIPDPVRLPDAYLFVTIYRYHLALYYSWVIWSIRIPRSSWIPRYGIRPEKATEHTCDGQRKQSIAW